MIMNDQTLPQKSWFGRNWKWVVPVGCLTPILVCGGFFTLIISFVFGMIKSSDPYTQSLVMVKNNQQVIEHLGTQIEPGFLVTGNINVNNSSGDADISYSISGNNGFDGDVHVTATRTQGVWTFDSIKVVIDLGPRTAIVDVLADLEKNSDATAKP
jgi:hypothetical protein